MTRPSDSTHHSLAGGEVMTCRSCTSDNREKFDSEIVVHFCGLKNLDKPPVFVFPKLLVCMDCGFTEFAIPETELLLLGKDVTGWVERSFLSELSRDSHSEVVISERTNVVGANRPPYQNGLHRQ